MKHNKSNPNGQERSTRDQFTVVLEQINSKIDILVEGYQAHDRRFDKLESELTNFKADTESNFKSIADYLARIEAEVHGELQAKVDAKQFGALQKRVERLEEALRPGRFSPARS